MNERPIGIFDSGMGGLSVWNTIRRELPAESLLYFADGKYVPYGGRSDREIIDLTVKAFDAMADRGVKLAVAACNTATAAAIETLRQRYDFPIVGMEPAVKPAALTTGTGKVAILATEASFRGRLYRETSARYGQGVEILPVIGEGFVELVENDLEETPESLAVVSSVLEPVIESGADRIVLGCTHYNFLARDIRKVLSGTDIEIIDVTDAVERRVEYLLKENGLPADGSTPFYEFMTFGNHDYLERLRGKASRIAGMVL